jgi:hypothetical protein
MKSQTWSRIIFGGAVTVVVALASVNYVTDPFEIFHSGFYPKPYQINERFNKVEYLIANPNKFNGLMFGSSTIGGTHPKQIEPYYPDSRFYNFTLSNGNMYDYIAHLKAFVRQGLPLKHVYLQLDIETMGVYGHDPGMFLLKQHPKVSGDLPVRFCLSYLTGVFPKNIRGKIERNQPDAPPPFSRFHIEETGIWERPEQEQQIAQDCATHRKSPTFSGISTRKVFGSRSKQSLDALREIKKIATEHGIQLTVFIAPTNHKLLDTFVVEDYLGYLQGIAEITNFYDFSGYNSVALNNCNFYELVHYRPHVGKWVVARIAGDGDANVPQDFGHLVTRSNVADYVQQRRQQMLVHDKNQEKP